MRDLVTISAYEKAISNTYPHGFQATRNLPGRDREPLRDAGRGRARSHATGGERADCAARDAGRFRPFRPQRGRLEPTPEAMLLYDEVTQSLSGIDRLTQAILDIRQAQAGRLVVASQPGAAISLLPKLAAEFLRGRPGVTIRFVTRSSQTIKMIPPKRSISVSPSRRSTRPASTCSDSACAALPCSPRTTPAHRAGSSRRGRSTASPSSRCSGST